VQGQGQGQGQGAGDGMPESEALQGGMLRVCPSELLDPDVALPAQGFCGLPGKPGGAVRVPRAGLALLRDVGLRAGPHRVGAPGVRTAHRSPSSPPAPPLAAPPARLLPSAARTRTPLALLLLVVALFPALVPALVRGDPGLTRGFMFAEEEEGQGGRASKTSTSSRPSGAPPTPPVHRGCPLRHARRWGEPGPAGGGAGGRSGGSGGAPVGLAVLVAETVMQNLNAVFGSRFGGETPSATPSESPAVLWYAAAEPCH